MGKLQSNVCVKNTTKLKTNFIEYICTYGTRKLILGIK